MMYSQHHATMAPPQKPETFMLSSEAQQSLPQDAQVALQQVDNCKQPSLRNPRHRRPSMHPVAADHLLIIHSKILFNICSRRLDPRPIHPPISSAHGRIRFLRSMVCLHVETETETESGSS